jgi:hypothetical protein
MTDAELDADDDADADLGPSLAFPPLYVLRTAVRCPECGNALHVYALGCTAFRDAGDSSPVEEFHFLRMVSSVPEEITALLKKKCPSFFLGPAAPGRRGYLMNHCGCGATLDDDFTHGDVGAAFFPDTPEGFEQLMLFTLPINQEIPVYCTYMLGGGEYLSFAQAEAW